MFTIHDALAILRRYWKISAAVFASIIVPVALVALLMPPLYESFSTIVINRDKNIGDFSMKVAQPDQSTIYRTLERRAEISTYAAQMTSSSVVDAVREELNLTEAKLDHIHDARKYVRLIYKSTLKAVRSVISEIKYLFRLSRRPTAETAGFLEYQNLMINIRERVRAAPRNDSNIIRLSFQSSDPALAMDVANSMTKHFVESYEQTHNATATTFFEDRTEQLERELIEAENNLQSMRSRLNVYSVEDQRELLVGKLSETQVRIKQLNIELSTARTVLTNIAARIGNEPETVVTSSNTIRNPVNQALEERLAEASRELSVKRREYTAQSPPIRKLEAEIEEIERQLTVRNEDTLIGETTRESNPVHRDLVKVRMEHELRIVSIDSELEGLKASLSKYSQELDNIGSQGTKLGVLGRKVTALKEGLQLHLRNREQAKLAENMARASLAKITVSDYAFFPTQPVRPRKKLYLLIGLVAALGMALLTPFILFYNDLSVRSDSDVEDILGPRFVANIPRLGSTQESW